MCLLWMEGRGEDRVWISAADKVKAGLGVSVAKARKEGRKGGRCVGLEVKKSAWVPQVGRDCDRDRDTEVEVFGPGLVNFWMEKGKQKKTREEADSMFNVGVRCVVLLLLLLLMGR